MLTSRFRNRQEHGANGPNLLFFNVFIIVSVFVLKHVMLTFQLLLNSRFRNREENGTNGPNSQFLSIFPIDLNKEILPT